MSQNVSRLRSLDGLRAVAILLVMVFHYFYAFARPVHNGHLYPYQDYFAGVPIFKFGDSGVLLFFLISGFVISLTLENCATVYEFLVRRFARLWPPLAAWSAITFLLLTWSDAPFAKLRAPLWEDFLPSLTFTPREMWRGWFPGVEWMDFVYWTLVVEVRFYLIAAIVFFALPRIRIGLSLTAIATANFLARAGLQTFYPDAVPVYNLTAIPDHLPWFAAGSVFYELYAGKIGRRHAAALLSISLLLILKMGLRGWGTNADAVYPIVIPLVYFVVLWAVATHLPIAAIFASPWLAAIGLWSYSIYLLHQPVGLVLISIIPHSLPIWLSALLAGMVCLIVIALGYVSYMFIERPGQQLLSRLLIRGPRRRDPAPTRTA